MSGESAARVDLVQVTAYPNPSRGRLTISVTLPSPGPVRMVVSDMLGRTVYRSAASAPASAFELPLDISGVAPGVYSLAVEAADLRQVLRLTLSR